MDIIQSAAKEVGVLASEEDMSNQAGKLEFRDKRLIFPPFSNICYVEWGNLVNIKYFYLQKAFGKILSGRLMAKIKNEALGDKFAYEQATETYGRRKYLADWKGVTYSPSQESVLGPVGFALYFLLDFVIKIQTLKQSKTD